MASTRNSNSNSNSKKSGVGCLVWLILLFIVIMLFVLNWNTIHDTISKTGFDKVISLPVGKSDDKTESPKPKENNVIIVDEKNVTGDGSVEPEKNIPVIKQDQKKQEEPKTNVDKKNENPEEPKAQEKPVTKSKPNETQKDTTEKKLSYRNASLFFIYIDNDGVISRQEVKRNLPISDSPMTDAVIALLDGPDKNEQKKGFISLIPDDVNLISAVVKNSTAYLNFNENFMYNRYGIEGYAGQLKQIIYTVTEFSTVKDVQILIEGKIIDYLGGDGVYIGKPLSRTSF